MQIAGDFGTEFTSHIVDYLNRVISQTQHDVGKCWPISLVYNATVVSGCNKILDPYVSFLYISNENRILLYILSFYI